jgi:transcriptional regulator with XRE-family HTH domain
MNQIAPRVRKRRDELSLAQDELCARISLVTNGGWIPAWQDISRIEHGARLVCDLEILALANALECSPCWLLTGEIKQS